MLCCTKVIEVCSNKQLVEFKKIKMKIVEVIQHIIQVLILLLRHRHANLVDARSFRRGSIFNGRGSGRSKSI